ncbi:lysozyme inhibitor LprI family protein [Arcobacter sp.]|uniref:lysozyme inhibitor LprI family protein n=1 Tax=Arcobacter sp. TaxID=1872629 RepID=UPI003C786FC9
MKNIFLILIFFSSLIFAENIKFYKPSFDCSNVKKGTAEYIICANEYLSKDDKELNNLYSQLLKNVSKEKIELIKESQYKWIRERQRNCNTESCISMAYIDRKKELQMLFFENVTFKSFTFDNEPIHPGCLYELLSELNGDHIVKKIDLINCTKSNKYIMPIETITINNQKYIRALVDNKEIYTQYHLIKYLGHGLYEFEIMSYPAKSGTIVSKEKIIVKLDKDSFYTSIWSDGQDYIYKKDYLELQLLLNITDRDGAKLKQQYEKIKQKIINKYSQKGDENSGDRMLN